MKKNSSGRRPQKKKSSDAYQTFLTVLITLLSVAIILVLFYAWRALGISSHTVTYTSNQGGIIGTLPEVRQFDAGDEVVVRSGGISRKGYEFVGWRDVHGVIEATGGILENGSVFKMPKSDVLLEAVWEDLSGESPDATVDTPTETQEPESDKLIATFMKNPEKTYVNVRDNYGYEGEVVCKLSDSSMKVNYYGKAENLFDEDDQTTYTWFFVEIPDLKKEGWIRSDMLEDYEETKEKVYVMASGRDEISLYEDADLNSDIKETVTDNEITFTYKSKSTSETTDGEEFEMYLVENNESGKTGWVKKSHLQEIKE